MNTNGPRELFVLQGVLGLAFGSAALVGAGAFYALDAAGTDTDTALVGAGLVGLAGFCILAVVFDRAV